MSPQVYTLDQIRGMVRPVAKRHGVQRLYVFGSYGRGEATPQSDVDLHLCGTGDVRSLLQVIALQQDMEAAMKKHVDIVTDDISDRAFLERIRKDEVLVYE